MDESFTPKQKSLWLSSSARLYLGGRVSCVHSFDCWTRGKIDWFQLNQINKIGAPDVGAPNVGRRRPDRVCRLLSQFAKKNQMKPAECVQNRNNARIYCFLPDEFFSSCCYCSVSLPSRSFSFLWPSTPSSNYEQINFLEIQIFQFLPASAAPATLLTGLCSLQLKKDIIPNDGEEFSIFNSIKK